MFCIRDSDQLMKSLHTLLYFSDEVVLLGFCEDVFPLHDLQPGDFRVHLSRRSPPTLSHITLLRLGKKRKV